MPSRRTRNMVSLLRSLPGAPLITPRPLDAPWATDATAVPVDLPVKYWQRGRGSLGDIAGDENNGLLISKRVADELRLLAGDTLVIFPAVVENPSGELVSEAHVLLRVGHLARIDDIESLQHVPVAAIRFDLDYIVVSDTARERLESIGIPSDHFGEPLFAGGEPLFFG